MREDIILAFCSGKRPKDLIEAKIANPKTIYYYHSIYQDLKESIISDDFVNAMIRLLLKLRIREVKA